MKNRIYLKEYIIKFIIVMIILFIILCVFNILEYRGYNRNFNNKIENIVSILLEKYPNLTENEIVRILNNTENIDKISLKKYGIDSPKDSIIFLNDINYKKYFFASATVFILFSATIIFLFIMYDKKRHKKIDEILRCMENINQKNYELNIDEVTEDELSTLRSEIYKTTIMLKEQAENSISDKISLKNSLQDISHQIKTPLTSIIIMLDSIIDDEDMDKTTRYEFLMDIKRQISNISFLVQSLLKLSKFEANTVKFVRKSININDAIQNAVKNVESLCDLKNVKINLKCSSSNSLVCDFKWQVEAITNILKNAVEHSNINGVVEINITCNNVYLQISIKNYGDVIDESDILHIFDRFYKTKNSSKDSFGIGLCLAKKIIENDNGRIQVSSSVSEGTIFNIKYFIN